MSKAWSFYEEEEGIVEVVFADTRTKARMYLNELETFDYCSEYGCYLDESTIDKIAVEGDKLMFYFNENTNDCEDFNEFLVQDLKDFYNDLKAAITDSIAKK